MDMACRQRLDMEDAYKRKVESRLKLKNNPFKLVVIGTGKSSRCKFHFHFHPLNKLLLLTILILGLGLATFLAILLSSSPSPTNAAISPPLSSDPRYVSDLDINWEEITTAFNKLPKDNTIQPCSIGLVNFNDHEIHQWNQLFIPTAHHYSFLQLDYAYADKNITWESLYPEWIDEEHQHDGDDDDDELPICPSFPKIQLPTQRLHLIAVKLPCPPNCSRDIARLHLQILAARFATATASSFKDGRTHPVHILFMTTCFPLPNLFPCKDLVAREGNVWVYKPRLNALREKLQLPIGSCQLALHLDRDYYYSGKRQREAYATILHSAHDYVCGAITAAQSIRMSGSTRDLVILVDGTISEHHRSGLELVGWKVRTINRIRNPKAEKDAYNEWNYSKFRLWQLTDYDKIIFIDADLLILRNIDFLFRMPEISATGNNGTLFNSGVMVVEPSNCTFQLLMDHINEIESYNGGDQGYLNEIFTWWHRIPKHMNFLKNFWIGDDELVKQKKIRLFEAEPPILYVLHYLGNKPWMCFRDYDCNWNVNIMQEFASDIAHRKWWKVHDAMPEKLQEFCLLASKQKAQLEWDRRQAEKGNYTDGHWKVKIRDKRIKRCIDPYCHWQSMLRHWGETNWTESEFRPGSNTTGIDHGLG